MDTFDSTLAYALDADKSDSLNHFRNQFHIPGGGDNSIIYFCGNSLGLQPKSSSEYVLKELEVWATKGVEGHFEGADTWVDYHQKFKPLLANLVGALPSEVVAMNSLTANLHLLLATFYKPTSERHLIITEAKNFSSDIYALQSQVKLNGMNPAGTIIEIPFQTGNYTIDEEEIIAQIKQCGSRLSLVMLSAVNYYTGQCLDVARIAKEAHKVGAKIGLDLAHAIGNVRLDLHHDEIDFAVWCTYKYLNSGPGAVGGAFVHIHHAKDTDLVRPSGWWGNTISTRFQMKPKFEPSADIDGFQLSNAPVLSMAAHYAALKIFEDAGWDSILLKSKKLSNYLLYLIEKLCVHTELSCSIKLISPKSSQSRGAQLSFLVEGDAKMLLKALRDKNCVIDLRDGNVIRIAPVPLYNSFEEVYRFVKILSGFAYLV